MRLPMPGGSEGGAEEHVQGVQDGERRRGSDLTEEVSERGEGTEEPLPSEEEASPGTNFAG